MAVIRWKSSQEAERSPFQRNFWFDNFSKRFLEPGSSMSIWEPLTNVVEKDDGYSITIELPGVKKEDVKITLVENSLTIKGEKKKEEKVEDKNYYRMERTFGSFQRTFHLPNEVDASKVKASFKDGILNISLVKKEEAKPKEISIKVQ